jgi:hypothetical protein
MGQMTDRKGNSDPEWYIPPLVVSKVTTKINYHSGMDTLSKGQEQTLTLHFNTTHDIKQGMTNFCLD